MVTISLKVSENLAHQLEQEAKQSSRSRSEVIREALQEKFESKKKRRTMADVFRECGGFFEGPEDLSTNPKHMEGFGE
jgi:metal-responsive CopG/Arc/MetJ family transcriptional regulator